MAHRRTPPATVELIRQRHAAGESVTAIAQAFGVSASHVSNVVRGVAHPDDPGPVRKEHGNYRHGRFARRRR